VDDNNVSGSLYCAFSISFIISLFTEKRKRSGIFSLVSTMKVRTVCLHLLQLLSHVLLFTGFLCSISRTIVAPQGLIVDVL
jgi:hypothetical protein